MKTRQLMTAVALCTGLGVVAAPVSSQDLPGDFSGNVTLTSDYVFRGVTQANEDPAIQGGLDWDSGAGFYLGTWGSNVNFGDGDEASVELDIYGGYAGEINGFSYDVGFLYYWYPGAASALSYDFWEVYGSLGYDFGPAAVSFGLAYTPDNFGGTDDGLYFQSGISLPLGDMFSVDANLNYSDVDPSLEKTISTGMSVLQLPSNGSTQIFATSTRIFQIARTSVTAVWCSLSHAVSKGGLR
jgi:uncharacterized protein (TIGR02001 family)